MKTTTGTTHFTMSPKSKHGQKKTGKTKHYVRASTSKAKQQEHSADNSDKELISVRLLKTEDNNHLLPTYNTILNRTVEEGVRLDDLDGIQMEMEALLSTTVMRKRAMQGIIRNLDRAARKQASDIEKSKPGVSRVHKGSPSPGKNPLQGQSNKILKEISPKCQIESSLLPSPIKIIPVKCIAPFSTSRSLTLTTPEIDGNKESGCGASKDNISENDTASEGYLPKNDTADKFWSNIDPYFPEICKNDIKFLDGLIAEHDNDAEYQKVPPLGRNFRSCCAQEEIQDQTDKNVKRKLRRAAIAIDSSPSKKFESTQVEPLTRRHLSCLMEENIMVPLQKNFDVRRKKGGGGEKTTLKRILTTASTPSVKGFAQKEMTEKGYLNPTELDDSDDEILVELRKCQAELKVIGNYNLQHLIRLKQLAIQEMARQELNKKLQIADRKVIEISRKISAVRQKKMSPTKEDVAEAWKCLKEREILVKQIDNI